MDSYLKLEHALSRLVNEPIAGGRFYNSAGNFEGILKQANLTPDQKAELLAEFIISKIPG